MKEFNIEARIQVENKLKKMQSYLDTYNKVEREINNNPNLNQNNILEKIRVLRIHKANEAYSIIKKYGWLSKSDISAKSYETIFNSILNGDISTLILLTPYLNKALLLKKISEAEFNMVLEKINSLATTNNPSKKEVKALK